MNPAYWILIILAADVVLDLLIIRWIYRWVKDRRAPKKGWINTWNYNETELHTTPVNDLMEHHLRDGCSCSPRVVPVEVSDGSGAINWQVIHNAMDGRE